METVKVRNIVIGEGMPKICVPIVAGDDNELRDCLGGIVKAKPDIVEFRADIFLKYTDKDIVNRTLSTIRESIGDTVLLYTIRTLKEGGNADVTVNQYEELLMNVIESGLVDMVDVEAFMQEGVLGRISKAAHEHKVVVVASSHDFEKTPDDDTMLERLRYMDGQGADIPKLAVMPRDESDVAALLNATLRYNTEGGDKPVITMSMGRMGLISRLAGEVYGSAVTFAAAGKASAPGQISVDEVRYVLGLLHGTER